MATCFHIGIFAFAFLAAAFLLGYGVTLQGQPQAAPQTIGVTRNPKDGAEMVWIPAGEFLMGNSDRDIAAMVAARPDWKTEWFADERPRHTVMLPGYWMYKYPVTVAQYRRFCDETEREMPELPTWAKDTFPIVNVTWFDAAEYAKWAGVRLPTEAEWEKAARGTDARMFPWGNIWDIEKCNNYSDHNPRGGGFQAKMASPVGSYTGCVSPFGVQDMAGNVWEWCQDWYDPGYYGKSTSVNPQGPATGKARVLRGGAWGSSSVSLRCACRHSDAPDTTYHDDGGFRCAMSEKK